MILRPVSLPSRPPSSRSRSHSVFFTLAAVLALALVAMLFPELLDSASSDLPRLEPEKADPPETRVDIDAKAMFESGSWRVQGQKYFVFQSSGGLSNQRIMIENALLLGRALNRTVIVPPLAPHSSMWWNYNKIIPTDTAPYDTLMVGFFVDLIQVEDSPH